MGIVHGEGDERQARVDRMIDEFRQAQSRRQARTHTVRGDDGVVQPEPDAPAQAAVAVSIPSH
jgi:hypothetical protein